MEDRYDHRKIEKKWQQYWEENKTFRASDESQKPKYYVLDMFPYPSGAGLHVGHPEGYTASDILARYKRMQGFEVLHPMGWDAFGLPAENYAIKTGTHPRISTEKNIETFTKQIKSIGFSYDWDREIDTTDPAYFKWTQWIFLQLFNSYFDKKEGIAKPISELKGLSREEIDNLRLAYEKEAPINFCPSCKTGLANEEVVDGECDRCHSKVERKNLRQWLLRITDYAERLLLDLETPNLFILHGFGAQGDSNFFPWLKKEGEKRGFNVFSPSFPHTENPQYNEWKDFFNKEFADKINENTVFICHSLGCAFLIKWLAETNQRVGEVVFVAPPANDCGIPQISNFFTEELPYESCPRLARKITILGSDNDDFIPLSDFVCLTEKMRTEFLFLPNRRHLSVMELPELLPFLDQAAKNILDWPEKIKLMQKNWIGRSEGVNLKNKVKDTDIEFEVYDSIPQTFMAQTFTIIAPEHPMVEKLIKGTEYEKPVLEFVEKIKIKKLQKKFDIENDMEGIFTGRYVKNYANTGRDLPIWIASFAVVDYGTGMVNCSAHDERDFAFAKKYNIPLRAVLLPKDKDLAEKVKNLEVFYREPNGILQEPIQFQGRRWDEARSDIIDFIESKNYGRRMVNYKLRDWIFSRQRYWGEPIPIVHCEKCGNVAMDEKDLPLELPEVERYEPSGTGESPLVNIKEWVETKCPQCGGIGKRETNTMPQWAGSSWYWLRFMDPRNTKGFCETEKFWGPVDMYVGGAEHAVLHLLYARFWHKVLYDLGFVSTREPFKALRNQGMILAEDGQKMSKSMGNVINPDDIIKQYGADTLRVYEMFMGPFEQAKAWSTGSTEGIYRFLQRIWRLYQEKSLVECGGTCGGKFGKLPHLLHKTIKKVSEDIENFKFNTAISQIMIFTNEVSKFSELPRGAMEIFCKLLSPFAPHLAEEIWHTILNKKESIACEKWPEYNREMVKDEEVELAIQINGKLRATEQVPVDISKEDALSLAKNHEKVQKWLENKKVIKEIFVPGKIVNLVVQ